MTNGSRTVLSRDLQHNETVIDTFLKDCPGFTKHRIRLQKHEAVLFFIEALINKDFIQRDILGYLLSQDGPVLNDLQRYDQIPVAVITRLDHFDQVSDAILDGQAVFISY